MVPNLQGGSTMHNKTVQNSYHFLSKIVVKKANILRFYHWFSHKMISDKGAWKFYTDDASLPRVPILLFMV